MPPMRARELLILIGCAGCSNVLVGCERKSPPQTSVVDAEQAAAHGDHSPHHGGVVMMQGDLHYEIVLDASGQYRLYFTDATRADLPAAAAANAAVTVVRPGEAPEGIELAIDASGESWIGHGRPVTDPSATTARVAYTMRGEAPYWIDLPFDVKASAGHE
jgi:hypothetical protein